MLPSLITTVLLFLSLEIVSIYNSDIICGGLLSPITGGIYPSDKPTDDVNVPIEIPPIPISDFTQFQIECLNSHNSYRTLHNAPPLDLNEDMNKWAQKWADTIAAEDSMIHNPTQKYGENIYWSSSSDIAGSDPVETWYKEIKDYDFDAATFSMSTGHFTQVVWKSSSTIGVGIAKSKAGGTYCVTNYDPPGNMIRKFKENVSPKMIS